MKKSQALSLFAAAGLAASAAAQPALVNLSGATLLLWQLNEVFGMHVHCEPRLAPAITSAFHHIPQGHGRGDMFAHDAADAFEDHCDQIVFHAFEQLPPLLGKLPQPGRQLLRSVFSAAKLSARACA